MRGRGELSHILEALPRLEAVRYETPLREGGSLPAIVEASDDRQYVIKFHGAGQGPRVLAAEVIVGGLAQAAGLLMPDMVLLDLAEGFGRTEPDPEIQDLLRKSTGLNVGFRYLPGSVTFDPYSMPGLDPETAARVLWLDALVLNVDRTARNPNLLLWKERVYLIDHGAALYFHHGWRRWRERIQVPLPGAEDHLLLRFAGSLDEAGEHMRTCLRPEVVESAVGQVPDEWLPVSDQVGGSEAQRAAYIEFITARLGASVSFVTALEALR